MIIAFAVLAIVGLLIKVFYDRDIPLRQGLIMFGLIVASAAAQLSVMRRYSADLNSFSIICMVAFFVIYARNVSRRVADRTKRLR